MGKRYDMQKCWNDDRKRFSGLDINVKFNIMAQCMFDISETLALIYDKVCDMPTAHQYDDSSELPI